MDHGALDDALEARCGLCIFMPIGDEVFEFLIDVFDKVLFEHIGVDRAGAHNGSRILIVEEA
jgi:hypothetical protein